MKAVALCLALCVWACSSGGLDDKHDPYLALFGIPKTPPQAQKGALLGRVLRGAEEPAAWAQVYARRVDDGAASQPVESLTNGKGGFLLPALDPGTWRLIATTTAGEGLVADLAVEAGVLREEGALTLTPLRRVTGKVELENEPAAIGVLVYAPGTPFSSFTDGDGYFSLNLPAGGFHVRAEKDTFMPADFDGLALTGDQELSLVLKANPWPNGRVSVKDAEGGVLARTLSPTLLIEPVPGVKYMRLLGVPALADPAQYDKLRHWQPVQRELTLTLAREGAASATFEFMGDGKTSEPVDVAFMVTALDPSWIVLFGRITQPMTIKAGQKVAFFDGGERAGSVQLTTSLGSSKPYASKDEAGISDAVQPSPAPIEANNSSAATNGSLPGWQGMTVFTAAVTVEAGATLRGAASFEGPLAVQGTAAAPVVWHGACDDYGCRANLSGADVYLKYLQATEMIFSLKRWDGDQRVVVEDGRFERVGIEQSADMAYTGDHSSSQLAVSHSEFHKGFLTQDCHRLGDLKGAASAPISEGSGTVSGSSAQPPHHDAPVPGPYDHSPSISAGLEVAASVFDATTWHLGCARAADLRIEAVRIAVRGNAFRAAPEDGKPILRGSAAFAIDAIPDAAAADYAPGPNWFADPGRAAAGVTAETWPVPVLGELLTSTPEGAGVR